jgi:hypothetical protein
VAVIRPGSVAVSLSCFCPTAASLLVDGGVPLRIETDASAFAGRTPYEGLDVRTALPPLLRADALFSWSGFDLWERFVIDALAETGRPVDVALARIAAAAERFRSWSASRGDFDDWCRSARGEGAEAVREAAPLPSDEETYRVAVSCVPEDLQPAALPSAQQQAVGATDQRGEGWSTALEEVWHRHDGPIRRYLASRAWASWVAHEAGVRGYVRWLGLVRGVFRVELRRGLLATAAENERILVRDAVRRADHLLVHLCSPAALARRLRAIDAQPLASWTWVCGVPAQRPAPLRAVRRPPRWPRSPATPRMPERGGDGAG